MSCVHWVFEHAVQRTIHALYRLIKITIHTVRHTRVCVYTDTYCGRACMSFPHTLDQLTGSRYCEVPDWRWTSNPGSGQTLQFIPAAAAGTAYSKGCQGCKKNTTVNQYEINIHRGFQPTYEETCRTLYLLCCCLQVTFWIIGRYNVLGLQVTFWIIGGFNGL